MRGKSKKHPRIAVDLLGSDTSPAKLLTQLLSLFKELQNKVSFTLFISPDLVKKIPHGIEAIVCKEVITMEDDPLLAVRKKKNASLIQGIRLLKEHKIDAFISAGNTGAMLASSQMNLPLFQGIKRAALLTLLPTKQKEIVIIDVGANVSSPSEQLVQFALMGVAYQKSRGVAHPKIGLLNIGSEPKKGTVEIREAYEKLSTLYSDEKSAIFVGNIEARDVFQGEVDVLVTDGFSGNIFLKTAEGLAAFILDLLENQAALEESLPTLYQRLHYAEYPGAILCGVEGVIVKCHGTGSALSFINSIKEAKQLVEHGFLKKVKSELLTH